MQTAIAVSSLSLITVADSELAYSTSCRARSFHQDSTSRQPKTPPGRSPKLSMPTTPPGPPPSFPPPARRASPGRAADNLPLPPRSTVSTLGSTSSLSPPRSISSQQGVEIYSVDRRGSGQTDDSLKSRNRERTVSTPKSGAKSSLRTETQYYEMQDRSPVSALTHSPSA
jgi:hypothetical protein